MIIREPETRMLPLGGLWKAQVTSLLLAMREMFHGLLFRVQQQPVCATQTGSLGRAEILCIEVVATQSFPRGCVASNLLWHW